MKIRLKMTAEDIAHSRAKFIEEQAELAKRLLNPKGSTGNTRNAALREMLIPHFGTKVKVTNATMPKPVRPGKHEKGQQ
jgi:hypothetical protein